MKLCQRVNAWFARDLWRIRTHELSGWKAIPLKIVRVAVLTWREFWNDRVTLRASAMTFYTLLSIVPLLLLAVAFSSRFGLDQRLIQSLYDTFPEQSQILDPIFVVVKHFVYRATTPWVALSGFAVALWSVTKVLMHMDRSFTDIWGVEELRPLWRRAVDYLILLIAFPSILLVASTINIFLHQEVVWLRQQESLLYSVATPLLTSIILLFPYLLIVILFTFLYLFVPNTRVRFSSALVGGAVAGAIYQVVQWGYIRFQSGVSHFDVVYGSLAAIPLLIVWLELSWLILLVGAEISYAFQNMERYEFAYESRHLSHRLYRTLSLYLLARAVREGGAGLVVADLAHRSGLPLALCERVVEEWVETGIAGWESRAEERYSLLPEVGGWRVKQAIDSLEARGENGLPLPTSPQFEQLSRFILEIGDRFDHSPSNLFLRDLYG